MNSRRRAVEERVNDWHVVIERPSSSVVRSNATRCMDCGVAFCEYACPLGNLIPQWNELVATDQWQRAIERLHATNNFPEFTGWLCPAPCEPSCVLAIDDDPVAIKQVELAIIDRAYDEGWIEPLPTTRETGRQVAVVGSGPAGLAAAQQLVRAGHGVVVFERDDRIGGLLRYGIPDFKMEKDLLDRRLDQLRDEGVQLQAGVDVGRDISVGELRDRFDAIILACGATKPRELNVPGAGLDGVHQGMEYLVEANRLQAGDLTGPTIDAAGRHVVIIGGGDTGLDCLGTANRQHATSVRMVDHNLIPPETRDTTTNPWPQWPRVHEHGFAHEEGVLEDWQAEIRELTARDGQVNAISFDRARAVWENGVRRFEPLAGESFEVAADLVLLAMGFDGVEPGPLIDELEVELTARGDVAVDDNWATSTPGVYACGDATRGASLVVWAIADGRSCAAAVHSALTGEDTLPRPVKPADTPV